MAGSGGFDKTIVFFLLNCLLCITVHAEQHRLNVPRVLLPVFHDFPVNFTLEVTEGGCYHWSTSRPDIIRLIPTNEHYDFTCSSSVIVQTVTRETVRSTAIVLAEESNSGNALRCDVIVDAISSLNMVTTTRELFIEEAPEAFEVRAYDEQGNEFTTLAGIEFAWSMSNTNKRGGQSETDLSDSVLRFMTFEESPYETPNTVAMLDKIGKIGNIVLMEGVKTGTARVSVRLLHKEYIHVSPVEVDLIVIDNLIISPANVTVLQYDSFKYKIMQVHQGRLVEIQIPSNQYYLQAEFENILNINNEKGTAYALIHGRTKVFLHDNNVNEDYGVILPTAEVSIENVDYITIAVLPHRSRYLIVGNSHEIIIELFNSKHHKFHIGDNVDAILRLDDKFFNTKLRTKNGTHAIVVPIQSGVTQVEATLYGVVDNKGRKIPLPEKLTATAELTISSQVTISPHVLALPWDQNKKIRSDVIFKATGGDGSYVWDSRQPSIATVSQNGVVKIVQEGSTDVVVSMARNQNNRDVGKVHVLSPTKLAITEYVVEVAVGSHLPIQVALYGEYTDGTKLREIHFDDCKHVPFDIDISERNFGLTSHNNSYEDIDLQPTGDACTTVLITGQSIGTSTVTISYYINGRMLSDNVTVAVYEPLTVVHPEKSSTLLAVGTSRKIIFRGGPRPWLGSHKGYSKIISVDRPELVQVTEHRIEEELEFSQTEVGIFNVLCKALGEAVVTYSVSNAPTVLTGKRTEAVRQVLVSCAKPRFVHLQPRFTNYANCPLVMSDDKVIAHSNEIIRLAVIVEDDLQRRFDNVSTLLIDWTVQPVGTGAVQVASGSLEETFVDYQVVLPKYHFQLVLPYRNVDHMTVKAKVVGYQKAVLSKMKITPEWPSFPVEDAQGTLSTPLIETTIVIGLVNDTSIIPNDIRILNDPNNKFELKVSQGSGYYNFILSDPEIAEIRYLEPTRWISVIPKKSGTLQLSLEDLCLTSTRPAEAIIEVQQLGSLEIDVLTKVQVGSSVTAILTLYDTNGHIIEPPSNNIVNITYELNNGFIQLEPEERPLKPNHELRFTIHGMEEGEATIIFRSGHWDQMVESEPIGIEVFSPLKVVPNSLTILRGTTYQLSTTGGPKNTDREYLTSDNQVVETTENGILEGKSNGLSSVTVRAVGMDSKGNRVVHSEDQAEITVSVLEGIRITAPTTKIKVGAVVPLWAFGIPEQLTPLIIGSLKTPMTFNWASSDLDTVKLVNMYDGVGINIKNKNEVVLRAKAMQPGVSTVTLSVTIPCHRATFICDGERVYTASIKIEVFEELALVKNNEHVGAPVVLMAPHSVMRLRTNKDHSGGITTYRTVSKVTGDLVNEDEGSNVGKIITLDKNGIVRTDDSLGKVVLTVTNVETYGLKQTIPVVVEVKPVHYMMLTLKSNVRLRPGEELNKLPKGMEFKYAVEYFDNFGSKFDAANVTIKTTFNRADSIALSPVEDNSFSVKFLHDGDLILKVFNEKYPNGMADFAHMMIGDILFPTKTLITVGDIVCFSMPLLSADGDSGYWKSSAPEILSIDAVTGIGKARSPGYSRVKQSLTTHRQNELEVQVQPIVMLTLVHLRGKNITGMETFSVPLILKGKDEIIKENNILSRGLGGCRTHATFSLSSYPFTCNVQFLNDVSDMSISEVFFAEPRFDIKLGFYFCDIVPIGLPSIDISTRETTISINALSRDIRSNSIEVTYFPPVYIDTKEIVFVNALSNSISVATLDVYGVPSVLEHLKIEAPDQISVTEHSVSSNQIQYKLSLLRGQEEIQRQKVVITNDLTKQNIALYIRISKHVQFAHWQSMPCFDQLFASKFMIGTIFAICISIFYYWKTKIVSTDLVVKNKFVFAEKYPSPMKKPPSPCSPLNTTPLASPTNSSGLNTSGSPHKPFSAFEPVYGDPRGYYTPNARRNKSFHVSSI